MHTSDQVAIIGAGPYGLAIGAHLRKAGVHTTVYGRTMEFWKHNMPAGMLLRSSWDACHISDPNGTLSLDGYAKSMRLELRRPVPLQDFVSYGEWHARASGVIVDPKQVIRLERTDGHFRLWFNDQSSTTASQVIVAAGIAAFANRPALFDTVPRDFVSHACDQADLSRFANRRVVVVGGGQSALESAALLNETGATVEVIARQPGVIWLRRYTGFLSNVEPVRRVLYPSSDVGPPILNQIVHRPELFRCFPKSLQDRIAYRSIRPAGASWLRRRLQDVRITTARRINAVYRSRNHVQLRLDDGTARLADHVLLATGYRVDIARYRFLCPSLLDAIVRENGYPVLNTDFECSVRKLFFVGAPAALAFGPLMRFVAGTAYAAPIVAAAIVSRHTEPRLDRLYGASERISPNN